MNAPVGMRASGPYLERLVQDADGTYHQASSCEWDGHNFIALDASTYSQMVRVYCTKCGLQRRLPLKKDE